MEYINGQHVTCSLCQQTVPTERVVRLHGGRGREPKTTCIRCMKRSATAWDATGCPFCVSVAQRVLNAIEHYEQTGQIVTRPAVPTNELPQHRPGCPWEHDTLP